VNTQTKVALTLAIVVSGGAKILVSSWQPAVGDVLKPHLEGTLIENGYRIEAFDRGSDPLYILAQSENCRVKLIVAAPEGWHKFLINELRSPSDRSFFVFDGVQYEEQPVWTTWLDHQWWRMKVFLRLRPPIKPVLGVIESPGCSEPNPLWPALARIRF
jgi:hypothetical protein